jgi:hypothetical protein
MESVDASERKWACVAVSNLIQNDPSTRRLLQGKNVIGALIGRLMDKEEEVVVEAAGALRYLCLVLTLITIKLNRCKNRNLCVDGGYDICAEMYNKNIITPLKSFIPKACILFSFSPTFYLRTFFKNFRFQQLSLNILTPTPRLQKAHKKLYTSFLRM